MIYTLENSPLGPRLEGEGHFIAPSADLIGDIVLGARSSVWFKAVLRGDNDRITVGEGSNIQDGCVLHTDAGIRLDIAENVTVGHQAMLHGCSIGCGSLFGIQSVVLNGARIGECVLVGACSLITEGMEIPDGVLVVGSPARVKRELSELERNQLIASAHHYQSKALAFAAQLREQHNP